MKLLVRICIFILFISTACKKDKIIAKQHIKEQLVFTSFGDRITSKNSLPLEQIAIKIQNLKDGEKIPLKFSSRIKEVCSKKGCWMRLPLNETSQMMVRFKNYSFFMPLDSNGKEVIVEGFAYFKEISVQELRHYAEDVGDSKEEIAKITKSKKEFFFEANGVLLKNI